MSRFQIEHEMPLEDGVKSYTVQQHALDYCAQLGFVPAAAPQRYAEDGSTVVPYRGEIPSDLTVLNDQQLGQYMTLLSLWMDYVGDQLTLLVAARNEAEKKKDFIEAKIRLTYKKDDDGKKLTVQERDDLVQVDRRFIEANSQFLYYDACRSFVDGVYKAARQNYNAVSRRVTQRGQEVERGTRTHNVNTTRGPIPGQALIPGR